MNVVGRNCKQFYIDTPISVKLCIFIKTWMIVGLSETPGLKISPTPALLEGDFNQTFIFLDRRIQADADKTTPSNFPRCRGHWPFCQRSSPKWCNRRLGQFQTSTHVEDKNNTEVRRHWPPSTHLTDYLYHFLEICKSGWKSGWKWKRP